MKPHMHMLRSRGGSHIDLEELDDQLFRAPRENLWVPIGGRGVFGGQILGQALHAATRTVPGTITTPRTWACHSMHAYFLNPGNPNVDVIYYVKKTSERRSFVSRTVEAKQRGKTIFQCQASFARVQPGTMSEHQDLDMPDVPGPDECPSMHDLVHAIEKRVPLDIVRDALNKTHALPVEMRFVDAVPDLLDPNPPKLPPRRRVWMRVTKVQADGLDECCSAYLSDHMLLVTALLPHGIQLGSPNLGIVASLDHGMWFHAPFRADDWLLYDVYSPRLANDRGLSIGHMYDPETRKLCVTSVQEGLLRRARPSALRAIAQLWLKANRWFDEIRIH